MSNYMSCLYLELEKSFIKYQDNFVFENRLTYGQLLEEVKKTNFDLRPGSILLAELGSGEFFVKILLSALKAKLVFCPIALDSGDFLKAKKVLNPNAIYVNKLEQIHQKLDPNVSKICSNGGFVRFYFRHHGKFQGRAN